MSDLPIVQIVLLGNPVPKGRPRFRVIKPKGKPSFVSTYTDSQTAKYEERLAAAAKIAMGARAPLDRPLTVLVEAFMPIPPSWPRRDREAAAALTKLPTGTPDADNIAKIAQDALNEIVWRDDSIIICLTVQKLYSETPLLRVSVWPWTAE